MKNAILKILFIVFLLIFVLPVLAKDTKSGTLAKANKALDNFNPKKEQLLPRIYRADRHIRQVRDKGMSKEFVRKVSEESSVPFLEDLRVHFSVEVLIDKKSSQFVSLTKDQLQDLKLTPKQAFDISRENFKKLISTKPLGYLFQKTKISDKLYFLTIDDGLDNDYTLSLLLTPDVLEIFKKNLKLSGSIIVAPLYRNMILFCLESEPSCKKLLKEQIDRQFASEDPQIMGSKFIYRFAGLGKNLEKINF